MTVSDLLTDGLFIDGDWVETKDQDPNGEVRLVQLADVGDGVFRDRSNRFLSMKKARELGCTFLEPGDVLVARMPEPLGRTCLFPGVGQPAVTVVDVCIMRPNKARVRPQWLVKAVNSPEVRAAMQPFVRGTTRQRISRTNLGLLTVVLPPIDEQDAIIRSHDLAEEKRQGASLHISAGRRAIERFEQSLLLGASRGYFSPDVPSSYDWTGDLEEVVALRRASGGRRWQSPEKLDTTLALPDIPKHWTWLTLDELMVWGPQNGLYEPSSKYGSGYPILRIDDFQIGTSRASDKLRQVAVTSDQVRTYSLEVGDIIINRVNSPSHLGKSLCITPQNVPALFESNMMRLRVHPKVDPRYVVLFLSSLTGRSLLTRDAKWAVNPGLRVP
jgi:type I restriction enzyme S subunit